MLLGKILIITSSLLALGILTSHAQERSLFVNDYLDPFITNPACTGSEDYPVAHVAAEKKLIGFTGSPSTFLLTGNYRIGNYDFYNPKGLLNRTPLKMKDRVGLGFAIFQENYGPLSNTGGLLSYGYHLPMHNNARLSFGISVLMVRYGLASSMLNPDLQNDDYLLTGNNSSFHVNFGTGIYYHSTNFFAGASAIKLLPGISGVNEATKEKPGFFALGGYRLNNHSQWLDFEFSAALKKPSDENINVDLHSKIYIQRFNWLAISYNTVRRVNIQFALRFYRMWYVGYNYGFSLNKIESYGYDSHQISIGLNLGLFANNRL